MCLALGSLLAEAWDFHVLELFTDTESAITWIEQEKPDLLISEWKSGDIDSKRSVDALIKTNPSGKIIFISTTREQRDIPAKLLPFIIGVVDKSKGWNELNEVLRRWNAAQHVDKQIKAKINLEELSRLAPRELRLLCELGKGRVNKEIAQSLELSQNTVATYRKIIAQKLRISGSELVRVAVLARCLNLCD